MISPIHARSQTRTHTHAYSRTHTHTYAHTHAYTHKCTHTLYVYIYRELILQETKQAFQLYSAEEQGPREIRYKSNKNITGAF